MGRVAPHLNRKHWCPGWESNPHEEKSPEDFKFYSIEESMSYTDRYELTLDATSATSTEGCMLFVRCQ